jgi:hypothetical protein
MLHAPDKDARKAAADALKKIDPETYTDATRTVKAAATNGAAVGGTGAGRRKRSRIGGVKRSGMSG